MRSESILSASVKACPSGSQCDVSHDGVRYIMPKKIKLEAVTTGQPSWFLTLVSESSLPFFPIILTLTSPSRVCSISYSRTSAVAIMHTDYNLPLPPEPSGLVTPVEVLQK